MKKTPLLVSACLLGTPCRYDGRSKPNSAVQDLSAHFTLIPICPERDGGLPTPRPPCEIQSHAVFTQDGHDCTAQYEAGARHALSVAKEHGCTLALLKARSPSCGKGKIYDGTFSHTLIDGNGISADLLQKNGICVCTEDELDTLYSMTKKTKHA